MDYEKINIHSLAQLVEKIEKEGKEKVVSFNGATLYTDQAKYMLAFGKLQRVPNK